MTDIIDVDVGERLDIPAECYVVKAWFPDRPAPAIVKEIIDHVKATGLPHTWRGHTHTKPDRTSVPMYIGEFDLPEPMLKQRRWAPCPCCSPEHPKFGRGGKIGWFADEGVIRLLGPRCFASLNREAHEAAEAQLRAETKRRLNTDYLLSRIPLIGDVLTTVEQAIDVAAGLKEFHVALHEKLQAIRLDLWPYVRRDGELRVAEKQREFRRGADGAPHVEEIDGSRVYAVLPGYQLLDPDLRSFVRPLETAQRNLEPYEDQADIASMSDDERMKAANRISRSVRNAWDAIKEVQRLRKFADRVTINTLRGWGAHLGCPIPLHYEHRGSRICFGRSDYQSVSVIIPAALGGDINSLPAQFI